MIKPTGVKATSAELLEAASISKRARSAPVARVQGHWLHEDAAESLGLYIDSLAQRHGLPPPGMIDGEINHYGMSNEGEFTVYEPGPDPVAPPVDLMPTTELATAMLELRTQTLADMDAARAKGKAIEELVTKLEKLGYNPQIQGYDRPRVLTEVRATDWGSDSRRAAYEKARALFTKFMGWDR